MYAGAVAIDICLRLHVSMTNATALASPEQNHFDDPAACGLDWNLGPPSRRREQGRATYTAEEVASLLGVSTWAIYQAAKTGELAVVPLRVGRRLVWPRALIDQSLGLN